MEGFTSISNDSTAATSSGPTTQKLSCKDKEELDQAEFNIDHLQHQMKLNREMVSASCQRLVNARSHSLTYGRDAVDY